VKPTRPPGPSSRPRDTDADGHRAQLDALRRLDPVDRLQIALRMSDDARAVAMAGIAARHPDYSPQQVRWALLRQIHGEELFAAAWTNADALDP
jgi:hypothetical protein